MRKNITKVFIIMMAVLAVAITVHAENSNKGSWAGIADNALNLAVGEEVVIQLNAEIPADKTLNAFSCMIMYDEKVLEVLDVAKVEKSAVTPKNINNDKEAGEIFVNGFDVTGVKGKLDAAIVNVTVKALEAGNANISVLFSAFGASADDQFLPSVPPVKVTVH
ncbi:carbohydrate-binding domain-containing protein [Desulfonema limicola]|uniref:Carbohydrate-binding domain-containing protein n=1 Tax=Desulfonema limicola TaxID=45656 RepID=A0A975B4B1_9BACT|nr:hypothetical protein [Desulfonema limicola]QTA78557.1 carbohydrate-binding domain-containing protein [Desulfonema limicola]